MKKHKNDMGYFDKLTLGRDSRRFVLFYFKFGRFNIAKDQ